MTIPRSSFPPTKLCLSRGQLFTRCQIRPTGTGAPDRHLGHCTIPIPQRLTTCRFHPVPHLEEPGATAAKLPAGSYLPAAGQPARPARPPTAPGPAPRRTRRPRGAHGAPHPPRPSAAPAGAPRRAGGARGGGSWIRERVRHPQYPAGRNGQRGSHAHGSRRHRAEAGVRFRTRSVRRSASGAPPH